MGYHQRINGLSEKSINRGMESRVISRAESFAYRTKPVSLNAGSQKKRRLRARQRGLV